MGRKPKNKFIESCYAFEQGTEFRLYDVEIPLVYSLNVGIADPYFANAQTTMEYYFESPVDLNMLIRDVEDHGYNLLEIKEATRKLTDLCPRCHRKGIPKIEKKNTSDNRERSWRNKENTSQKKERPAEYWLTYTHSKHEKCRICQYENKPYPAYKKNSIEIEKYFFPYVIGNMKRGTFWYAD